MDRETINKHFERLDEALKSIDLQTEAGKIRRGVSAGEFMLMGYDYIGNVRFKHFATRNYLILREDGSVHIPKKSEPWMRGVFDHPDFKVQS